MAGKILSQFDSFKQYCSRELQSIFDSITHTQQLCEKRQHNMEAGVLATFTKKVEAFESFVSELLMNVNMQQLPCDEMDVTASVNSSFFSGLAGS